MTAQWLWTLLIVTWLGGCGPTTIVTPELKLGPSIVTLTTNITLEDTHLSEQAGETATTSSLGLGLRSTIRF